MEYLDNMINKNSFEEVEIDGKKFDLKKMLKSSSYQIIRPLV
jgi:hypothetical protein